MAAISLAKVSQALQGGVDFGPHKRTKKPYSITQKIEEMFGVTEEVATLPEVDDAGKVLRMTDHCYGKKIDRQAAADLNNIGPEAFGRSILGSAFREFRDRRMAQSVFLVEVLRGQQAGRDSRAGNGLDRRNGKHVRAHQHVGLVHLGSLRYENLGRLYFRRTAL